MKRGLRERKDVVGEIDVTITGKWDSGRDFEEGAQVELDCSLNPPKGQPN